MHEVEDDFDWPWLEGPSSLVPVAAGQSTIPLPAESIKVISIKDETNIFKLIRYDWHKFERDIREPEEKGLPELYVLTGTEAVQIWRVLERETNFRVRTQLKTADLSVLTDKPKTTYAEWPPSAQYPIVQRAAAIALEAENEEERAKEIQKNWMETMMKLKLRFGRADMDEPLQVEDVQGYGNENPVRWVGS
jgi:hypothetical protein